MFSRSLRLLKDSRHFGALLNSKHLDIAKFPSAIQVATYKYGRKDLEIPPNFDHIVLPERRQRRLPQLPKVPNLPRRATAKKNLADSRGPCTDPELTQFIHKQYGIVALSGGYMEFAHFEMLRNYINREMDTKIMFATWRLPAPFKPVSRKHGKRMGKGKGNVSFYVTPVKAEQVVLEVGGKVQFDEIKRWLKRMASNLPFQAKAFSEENLARYRSDREATENDNINPWTFERIALGNYLGMKKYLGKSDYEWFGKYR